jgi:hypothetical protein
MPMRMDDAYEFAALSTYVCEQFSLTREAWAGRLGISRASLYAVLAEPEKANKKLLHKLLQVGWQKHDELTRRESPFPDWVHDQLAAIERAVLGGVDSIKTFLRENLRTIEALVSKTTCNDAEGLGAAYVLGFAKFYLFLRVEKNNLKAGEEAVELLMKVYRSDVKYRMSPYARHRLLFRIIAGQFNLKQYAVAEDLGVCQQIAAMLQEFQFLDLVDQLMEQVPKDPNPLYAAVLGSAVMGDMESLDYYYSALVKLEPRFKDPNYSGLGFDPLGHEPIIKKLYFDRLFRRHKE